MTIHQPVPYDSCSDCGVPVETDAVEARCPACFDKYLFGIDAGFLESYRRFGCRSRLVVAESCLRSLVVESPDHRKVLAMTIFEQYIQAMNDLAGLFLALRSRHEAPILKTFLEFRLDAVNALEFFDSVRALNDPELIEALDLPLPAEVETRCLHLDKEDSYTVQVAIHHLVQDLRKVTEQGEAGALALAQMAGQVGGAIIAADAGWLNGSDPGITPDQVALLVMDSRKRSLYVQGLTAEEGSMGRVVDAVDAATRAASNLIYAYLQTNDL